MAHRQTTAIIIVILFLGLSLCLHGSAQGIPSCCDRFSWGMAYAAPEKTNATKSDSRLSPPSSSAYGNRYFQPDLNANSEMKTSPNLSRSSANTASFDPKKATVLDEPGAQVELPSRVIKALSTGDEATRAARTESLKRLSAALAEMARQRTAEQM